MSYQIQQALAFRSPLGYKCNGTVIKPISLAAAFACLMIGAEHGSRNQQPATPAPSNPVPEI